MISLFNNPDRLLRIVARSNLIGRHTAKDRVSPTRSLAIVSITISIHLHAQTVGSRMVMPVKTTPVESRIHKIKKRYGNKQRHTHHIR